MLCYSEYKTTIIFIVIHAKSTFVRTWPDISHGRITAGSVKEGELALSHRREERLHKKRLLASKGYNCARSAIEGIF